MTDIKPFHVQSETTLLDEPYCRVVQQRVTLPNGQAGDWFIHGHGGQVVVVLGITEDGRVLLIRNYKHGCGQIITELVAGMVDDGEDILIAAARELREETGYAAASMRVFGGVWANPTSSATRYHFVLARGIAKTHPQQLDDAEQIEPFLAPDMQAALGALCDEKAPSSSASVACALWGHGMYYIILSLLFYAKHPSNRNPTRTNYG